jgi:hypothetical protein
MARIPEGMRGRVRVTLLDLYELDEAGALGGIRAVIAERLRQVRQGTPLADGESTSAMILHLDPEEYAAFAALLAAEIDRNGLR